MKAMNEYDMSVYLQEMVTYADKAVGNHVILGIRHFMQANLLSKHMGLVVTMQDGSEFLMTVVQSKLTEEE